MASNNPKNTAFSTFGGCENIPIESRQKDECEYFGEPQLIAVVGDEDTCVGFILAGIGQIDENLNQNYIIVDPKMDELKLEEMFLDLMARQNIALILVTKEAAMKLSHILNKHSGIIPGHNGPFEFELPMAVKSIEERRRSDKP